MLLGSLAWLFREPLMAYGRLVFELLLDRERTQAFIQSAGP